MSTESRRYCCRGEKKGRIKSLIDSSGNQVKEAGPSTPIEVLGLEECVAAGEVFNVMKNEKDARAIIDSRLFFHKEKMTKCHNIKIPLIYLIRKR